jgi:hypothetical protein
MTYAESKAQDIYFIGRGLVKKEEVRKVMEILEENYNGIFLMGTSMNGLVNVEKAAYSN